MLSPSVLFEQLERRARTMRAVRYSGLLSAGCAVTLLATSSLMLLSRYSIPYAVLVVVGATVVLGLVGLVLGLRLPVHLPTLLLHADVALDLEATLSTLHDIQSRPDHRWLTSRIASRLPAEFPHPSKAFPVRVREVSLFVLAAALVLGTIFVVNIPARTELVPETLPVPPVQMSSDNLSALTPSGAGDLADPSGQQFPDASELSTPESTDPVSLSEILSSIQLDASGESTSADDSGTTILRPRSHAEVTLESILRQLEENLREDGIQVLSPDEIATLQTFRDSAPSEVAQALEQLMQASDNSEALQHVSDFLEDPQLLESSRELTIPSGADARADSLRDIETSENASMPMFEDTTDDQGSPAFVPTTLPNSESEEGSYMYYLTKGVPIEPSAEPREASSSNLELSYEQIETILSGRALAPDVLDTVKAYFDRIAGGGS